MRPIFISKEDFQLLEREDGTWLVDALFVTRFDLLLRDELINDSDYVSGLI
jgi:hypothetical protein